MDIIRPRAVTDAVLVSTNVAENDHAAYNGATTYADGDRVISTTTHKIYESLQNANTGNALPVAPATSTAWWIEVSATNRWKAFDGGVNTQTSNAESVQYVLTAGSIDAVALLNIQASTYRVTLTEDAGSPSVFAYDSGDVSVEQIALLDWYQYFYEAIVQKTDIVIDLPPRYSTGLLSIIIQAPGATAYVGMIVSGLKRTLGDFQWRPRVGIIDYSVKTTNDFGNVTVTQRAFAKRLNGDVFIMDSLVDEIVRLLTQYRATPVVWVGSDDYSSTIIYGFFKSFDVIIDSAAGSFCNLEIEGLT